MGLLDWVLRKGDRTPPLDRQRSARELSEFYAHIVEDHGDGLRMTVVQAADVAARLYAETQSEVDLRSPRAALMARPTIITELTEAVIQLQKAGRQAEAPGTVIWVHTLRAELMPELRPSVKQIWSLLGKVGFLDATAQLYEERTGRRLSPNYLIFMTVPDGFGTEF